MPDPNRLSDHVAGLTKVLHQLEQDQRETRIAGLPEPRRRAGRRGVFARAMVPVVVAGLIAVSVTLALPHLLRDQGPNFNTTGRSFSVEADELTRLRNALASAEAMQHDLQIELDIARRELRSRGMVTPWHDDGEMLSYRSPWTR